MNTDIPNETDGAGQSVNSGNSSERNHGGNGRQADRSALAQEMAEIQKLKERIKKDLARFEYDKTVVSTEISEIKARVKEAEDLGQSDVAKNWGIRLKRAEDMLRLLEKTAPSINPLSNEAILKELKGYRHARDKQTQAGLKINHGDQEAIGEYMRAQTEAVAISEKIKGLIKEREEKNIGIANPAQNEGISYTHEQALLDAEAHRKKHREVGQGDAETNTQAETAENQAGEGATQATAGDWQEKAVEKLENEKSGVPDAEFGHTPEEHDAILPILTDAQAKNLPVPTPTEVAGEPVGVPHEVQKEIPEKFEHPTERKMEAEERILIGVANAENAVFARAEKAGIDKELLHTVGEAWDKLLLRYKLLLSAGMFVFGVGATTVGAATAETTTAIGAGIRAVSGAGMFVGFEHMLKKIAEKDGVERSAAVDLRHTVLASALSVLVVGILPEIIRDYTVEHGIWDKIREFFGSLFARVEPLAKIETPVEASKPAEPAETVTVQNYGSEVPSETPEGAVSAEELLNGPLLTDFSPPEQAVPIIPEQTVEVIAPVAVPEEAPAPADVVAQEIIPSTTNDVIMTMPREILPSDPQVLAYADQQVHAHVTTLFGSKGFWGIGAVDGMKSANWLDFANRPVVEILNATPSAFPENGEVRVGMVNNEALGKMNAYLKIAFDETGVKPEPDEPVEKYLKRAAGMAIGKFMNKE